jgi:hypothetical protein
MNPFIIETHEEIDEKKLNYLKHEYTFEMFREHSELIKKIKIKDMKDNYAKVMKYVNIKLQQIKSKKEPIATYKYAIGRKDGRMYGGNSIQGINGFVRNFLLDDNRFKDLDIKNAFPTFLLNICNLHNILCPHLGDYIKNRNKILKDLMETDKLNMREAKDRILMIMFLHKIIKSPKNKWVKGFINEMYEIREKIAKIEEYDFISRYISEEEANENYEGCFLSNVLQIEENKILQEIIIYCREKGLYVFALMFDGLIIGMKDMPDDIREALSKLIAEKTIHKNIEFVFKPFDTSITMNSDYVIKNEKTYEEIKVEFEKNNCKVDCRFYCGTTQYSQADFLVKYNNFYYERSFLGDWLSDPNMRSYDDVGIYIDEKKCPKNIYNLWSKWNILQMKEENAKKEEKDRYINNDALNEKGLEYFKNHVKVLVNNDEKLYNFVINWLAQMFQYTEIKTIELIFVSMEGAGKGLFLQFLKTIMGNKKVLETTNPQREIFGNFNPLMKESILVVFNEANKSNFYNANDMKKALITDKTLIINEKNKNSIEVQSNHRFITFTNNADPSTKNKRRDLFIRCSDEKVGNKEYFEEGFKYAEDYGVCLYIYEYLMGLKVNRTITQFDIPISEYDEEIKEEQKHIVILFLDNFCNDFIDTNNTNIAEIDNNEMYKDFLKFKYSIHSNFELSPIAFHMKISFYKFKSITKGNDGNGKRFYTIKVGELSDELKHKV